MKGEKGDICEALHKDKCNDMIVACRTRVLE